MLAITAACWLGMAVGSAPHTTAEEGRSKLLLASVPQGSTAADEVAKRLDLWENGSLETLVQRIEQQAIVNQRNRSRGSKGAAKAAARGKKAKRMTAEGAYRKATTSLTSDMMQFTAEEDLKWATELLPKSSQPDAAIATRPANDTPAAPRDTPALDSMEHSPLKGVRYAALTAPGPSGTRAEHIRDMLSVPRRRDANRLLRALTQLHNAIDEGRLCDEARWLTRTRLCWQRKKNNKPRPIKMGEFLRSCYAKRVVHSHRAKLRTAFLGMHQWGVGLPGSAEALSHWRGLVEELITVGALEPMIAADLDLVNMFGNVEWPAIREAIQAHFSEASPWTCWQQEQPSVTTLPSGTEVATNRGAEQGDVFGSVQSAFALGKARAEHFALTPGACDEWYIDDGQVFCQPHLFDQWLQALDQALGTFGATRGTIVDNNVKSSCRLLCPAARRHEFVGWDTPYVHSTTKVLDSDGTATALGVTFGPITATQEAAAECVRQTSALREAICEIGHAPTELILTRQCADVSKLMYHMRINGDRLDPGVLSAFDGGLRIAVENTLGGDLPDLSWWQATTGVKFGGLGLRTAESTALAAFVASRIGSRPLVRTMVEHYAAATGASVDVVMAAYDNRTDDALVDLVSSLPPAAGIDLLDDLDAEAREAALAWRAIVEGEAEPTDLSGRAGGTRARPGSSITPRDGEGDDEHPDGATRQRTQHLITSYTDKCLREGLRQQYAAAGNRAAINRLEELMDLLLNHTWLWHVSQHHGPVLAEDEFVEAVRVLVGTAGPTDPIP